MLLWVLALALTLMAVPAHGQSLFSQTSLFTGKEGGPGPKTSESLQSLLDQVAQGNGRAVYAELKARYVGELIRAAAEGQDVRKLRRSYLLALLRAGEGLAAPADQERIARQFTEYYPDDEAFPSAFFYLNQARFQQGESLETSFFFDQTALESLPNWMQSRYLRMEAQASAQLGDYAAAAGFLLQEKEGPGTLHQTPQGEIEEMLEHLNSPTQLADFMAQHTDIGWLASRRPFLEARVLVNAGEIEQALLKLEYLETAGLVSGTAEQKYVSDLKTRIRTRVAVHPERIGVLLPLSSSSAFLRDLARETMDGLRLAVQFPNKKTPLVVKLSRLLSEDLPLPLERNQPTPAQPLKPFELVIRDTGNDPKQAARMVESLVREDQVVAIIGPIARTESEAAADKAEALGVPLISLSVSLDVPAGSHFVFRYSKSQEGEVRDLVHYAMDYLQARRFAILYPDSGYGKSMMKLFWGEVNKRHGRIVAASPFTPSDQRARPGRDAVGLKEIFAKFAGLDRYVSPEDLALQEEAGDSHPDPIVDFDALYIPIGPDGIPDLQIIAPYPVTVDAEHKLLLGSRFWNDDAVLVAGEGKLNGAVFLDAYDPSSTNPKVVAFQTRHRAFFGYRPDYRAPSYYTGQGYDAMNLVMSLLHTPANRTRKALSIALRNMQPFFGVTGWTAFKSNGEAVKESMFFRIRNNEIQRVIP